ncbi:MAG: fasciclin domain-containing protein [Bacteroidota bacterium]
MTVFAPTNATFASAQITVDTYDAATWEGILRNHIVKGQGNDDAANDNTLTLDPGDLTTGAEFTTLAGATLLFFNNTDAIPADNGLGIFIDSNGDVDLQDQATFTNFDAEVVLPDADGGSANGRVHVIAGVLAPPSPARQ